MPSVFLSWARLMPGDLRPISALHSLSESARSRVRPYRRLSSHRIVLLMNSDLGNQDAIARFIT